jgi:signal transduction histidine kinase
VHSWLVRAAAGRLVSSRALRRDLYIAMVALTALGLLATFALNPSSEPWNIWGILILFVAMVVTERLSVPLPTEGGVSIATIPHIMAVLLLPAWLAVLLAGSSMLLDQLAARATPRKLLFNLASVMLTVGLAAEIAQIVGLGRASLAHPEQWEQVPAFLLVAATYYVSTNGLAAILFSLIRGEPIHRIFLANAQFVLPAEFAVCGIGGLMAVLWVLSPAWAPVILFPAVVSQAALSYISSSKRSYGRLAFLAEASRVLASSLNPEKLLGRIAEIAVPALADSCLVYLVREDGTLERAASAHMASTDSTTRELAPAEAAIRLDPGSRIGTLLTEGRPVLIPEVGAAELRRLAPEVEEKRRLAQFNSSSLMSATLLADGRTMGALVFISWRSGRRYDTNDLALAEDLAGRCAVALQNARLHADAQQASRMRDDFLSVAAHELKTPLTSMRGYAQLLGRWLGNSAAIDPSVLANGFRVIETQAEKLGRLTTQLLDVSRIESGKLQLDPRMVDLVPVVRGAAAAVQASADNHKLQLRLPDACYAFVDPLRLEQVVTNLLSNAIKYSPNGGQVEVGLAMDAPSALCLVVRDWGVGIPPERRQHLFDRSYQAHGEGHFGGLGLGLYISRQIVELHRGRIDVTFPADGGSRFVVQLPVGPADSAVGSVGSADSAAPVRGGAVTERDGAPTFSLAGTASVKGRNAALAKTTLLASHRA